MKNILFLSFILMSFMPNMSSAQCDDAIGIYPPILQADSTYTPAYWTVNEFPGALFFGETRRLIDNAPSHNPVAPWVQTPAVFITDSCNGGIWIIDIITAASLRPHEHVQYRGYMYTYDGTEFVTATMMFPPFPEYPIDNVTNLRLSQDPIANCAHRNVVRLNGASIEHVNLPGLHASLKIEEKNQISFLSNVRIANSGDKSFTILNPSGKQFAITVFDILGRQVGGQSAVASSKFELSMPETIAQGMYFVVITANDSKRVERIIVR